MKFFFFFFSVSQVGDFSNSKVTILPSNFVFGFEFFSSHLAAFFFSFFFFFFYSG